MLAAVRTYLRYTSWPIIAAMLALITIGVVAISVSERADPAMRGFANRQIIYACAALGVFLAVTCVPYRFFGRLAYPLFALTLVVLVAMIVPKIFGSNRLVDTIIPEIRGARRWINLYFVQVQPSEFSKFTFIAMLAWYLRRGDHYRRLRGLIVPFVLTFVPMGLILLEPDLGTSLLFLPTLYFMLFMAGAKIKHLLGIMAVATALVLLPIPQKVPESMGRDEVRDRRSLAYRTFERNGSEYLVAAAPLAKMEHHQIKRLVGWLRQNDPSVVRSKGYQLHKSKLILGSGKVAGRDGWNDADSYFRMLPDDHTDFIFSVIGGQWGFLGAAAVLAFYAVIFVLGVEIASITYDPFGRLLAVGVLALLLAQIIINVGMTMGLMPITGMTLPFVSYGGSSLMVNCAALGLLINVGQRRPILLSKRPFEYGPDRQRSLALPKMSQKTGERG